MVRERITVALASGRAALQSGIRSITPPAEI